MGGGYNQYEGKHFGEIIWAQFNSPNNFKPRYYDNKATKKDGNVYLKTFYKLSPKLNTFVDLQIRQLSYDFTGFDNSLINTAPQHVNYNFFNPKVGINYLINQNLTAYASLGKANKEPNRNDLTQSSLLSRPKSEELIDLEIGATKRFKHFNISLNLYNMDYKNQLVLNGKINDVGAYNRVNVDASFRRGAELELNANITKYFTFNGNITLSKNKIKNFNEFIDSIYTQYKKTYQSSDISFSPNIISAANLIFKPIKNLELAFLNKYVGRQFLDNTSNKDRSIEAYLVNDFRINYTVYTKLINEINFMLTIFNILNKKYETNGYTYSYYEGDKLYTKNFLAPSAPTNLMIGLNVKF